MIAPAAMAHSGIDHFLCMQGSSNNYTCLSIAHQIHSSSDPSPVLNHLPRLICILPNSCMIRSYYLGIMMHGSIRISSLGTDLCVEAADWGRMMAMNSFA